MNILYTERGKKACLTLLTRNIGKKNITIPLKNSDKLGNYKINIKALYDNFKDNKIRKYEWNITNGNITFDQFIEFLHSVDINKSNDSRGMFHEYIDLLNALYEVEVDILPIYETIQNKKIYDIVHPKRDEYLFVWWLINTIYNFIFVDFFNKNINIRIFKDICGITYQESIRKGDNRFYDLLFKKLNIILEIQEDGKNHDNQMNDLTKEGMACLRGNRIFYFHVAKFKIFQYNYLKDFWNGSIEKITLPDGSETIHEKIGFKTIIIQALVAMDYENNYKILTNFILYESKIYYNELLNNINQQIESFKKMSKKEKKDFIELNKHNEEELKYLENIISNNNEDYIGILFGWYSKSFDDCDKYIIDPSNDEFKKIFVVDYEVKNELLSLCRNANYCGISNQSFKDNKLVKYDISELKFSWNGLLKIFLNPSMNENILNLLNNGDIKKYSRWMLELLINIERSFKKIILYSGTHVKECNNSSIEMINKLENHIKDNLKNEYEDKIKDLNQNIKQRDEHIKLVNVRTNRIIRKSKTLVNKVKNAFKKPTKDIINQINSIKKDVDEIVENEETKLNKYTIVFEKDKYIIKNNTNIKIIYTQNLSDSVEYNSFIGYCQYKKIPSNIAKSIWQKMVPNNDIGIPNNIFRIKIDDPDYIEVKKNNDSNKLEDNSNDEQDEEEDNSIESINEESDESEDELELNNKSDESDDETIDSNDSFFY